MPDAPFTIRPARPDDDAAMAELEHGSAIHHAAIDPDRWRVLPIEAVAESRRYWRATEPRDEALVAEADGQVIGMIELWLRRPKDRKNARPYRVEVHLGISVSPDARGQGVGTAPRCSPARRGLAATARNACSSAWTRRTRARSACTSGSVTRSTGTRWTRSSSRSRGRLTSRGSSATSMGSRSRPSSGELVTLRPIRPGDRAALLEVLQDPSVVAVWDTRGAENSVDELLAGDEDWTVWAIEAGGEFAGSIQAAEEKDGDYRHAGIDIFMHSRFQGRGLGTDAVRTLARYLLEVRGHHRLTIDPAADNARAIRTYEKVGFKPVGVMRRYERGRDGTYHDGLQMDMLAGELR